MQSQRVNMGIISLLSLVIGIISFAIYMTGDKLVDDNVTMVSSVLFLILALIFSLFSRKNVFGKTSLYISIILLGFFALFIIGMSFFWPTTP